MQQLSLFDSSNDYSPSRNFVPLADRMRPESLADYVGQKHLLGEGKILRQMLEKDQVCSMIFWGPPGVGKTTLARIIAGRTKSDFVNFSAVTSGIKEIKEIMKQAEENRAYGIRTLVFVDEIHRFNKAQQDAFLPYVEKGSITLIGATTENPSFEINAALLSRCRVFVLKELSTEELTDMLTRTMADKRGFGNATIHMEEGTLSAIASFANGDARMALNTLEIAILNGEISPDGSVTVQKETLEQCLGKKTLLYDKKGEEHYNLISALHKSMRNSDPDAAVYWLARMLEAGEDPLFIARRLIRFASEDIGLADSQALQIAVAAYQACHFNGMPECNLNLTQAVVYLSLAPRSNALYRAYETAKKDALTQLSEPVPLVIRNAPTQLMDDLHYGKGYVYAHDTEEKIARMTCLPESLKDRRYYLPTEEGAESVFKERLEQSRAFRLQGGTWKHSELQRTAKKTAGWRTTHR
ncbi:MAG: replication-associated recombination protein A [Lachnospiraceae bacterium]|nr:replication-associated recombination protein A [Lachnospiraceae bacterium]